MAGDQCAEARDHAPVHPAVLIAVEIFGRDAIPFRAADERADCVDEAVPAATRFEGGGRRNIRFALRDLFQTHVKRCHRLLEFILLRAGKACFQRRTHPGRRRPVDRRALLFRNPPPRIAVGGMQPAAAEIEREAALIDHGPRPASEPRTRLDDQTANAGVVQPAPGRNAGRTAADNHHVDIAGHGNATPNLRRYWVAQPPRQRRNARVSRQIGPRRRRDIPRGNSVRGRAASAACWSCRSGRAPHNNETSPAALRIHNRRCRRRGRGPPTRRATLPRHAPRGPAQAPMAAATSVWLSGAVPASS